MIPPILDRTPPQSREAEMSVLGAMIIESRCIPLVLEVLGAEAQPFYVPAHGEIYTTILAMYRARQPVELLSLREELKRRRLLESAGGQDYLVRLADSVADAANAEYYARIVRDKARARGVIALGNDAAAAAYDASDVGALVSDVQARAYRLGLSGHGGAPMVEAGQASGEALARAERAQRGELPPGLRLGFAAIDRVLAGLEAGDLVVIGGATSIGKSSFASNVTEHVAAAGGACLYVSAEMPAVAMGRRLLQSRSGVPGWKIRQGRLTTDEWAALQRAGADIDAMRLSFWCQSATVADIGLRARELATKWGKPLDLIVVDYLQLMTPAGGATRAEQIGGIAWGLKRMAMDLGAVVLLASQFDRASVKGPAGRGQDLLPTVHSLKESGDIENASNVVLLLHRPADAPEGIDGSLPVWCKIGKSRDGMTTPWPPAPGSIELRFLPHITRFL